MPIVAPNLDDRRFDELLAQARSLIPRYAPEWTNYNESDFGYDVMKRKNREVTPGGTITLCSSEPRLFRMLIGSGVAASNSISRVYFPGGTSSARMAPFGWKAKGNLV